jgi:hypothetical protein
MFKVYPTTTRKYQNRLKESDVLSSDSTRLGGWLPGDFALKSDISGSTSTFATITAVTAHVKNYQFYNAADTLKFTARIETSTNTDLVFYAANNSTELERLDQTGNKYMAGDVVAYASATPPVLNWWDSMPMAVKWISGAYPALGGLIIGSNLTIDSNGVVNASGGAGSTNWGLIGGDIGDQGDLALAYAAKIHNLVDTTNHPVSGLTMGHFLKALSATTYGFAAHGLIYSDVNALASDGIAVNSSLLESHAAAYFQVALTNPVTGTGTTGYIPKLTGTSTIGNSVIYESSNNIGIGTTAPSYKLHVNTATASADIARFGNTSNNRALIIGLNSGEIKLQSVIDGTDVARQLAFNPDGGNVGIGMIPVTNKLEVAGTITATGDMICYV